MDRMSLKSRLALRLVLVVPLVAALMFAPAGSFRFWQGWIFTAIFVAFSAAFVLYFYRRDRGLLERRLRAKEPRREQRIFKMFWVPLWIVTLTLPGLDYRFGWSLSLLGGVPVWLSGISFVILAVSWMLVFHVLRFNTFAAAIVQVEAGQKVITTGPYRIVRHPMYSGFVLMILSAPFALGSFVAVVPAVPLVPLLVFRLLDEERFLRRELPGYTEYCGRTRFRLLPGVF